MSPKKYLTKNYMEFSFVRFLEYEFNTNLKYKIAFWKQNN